MSGREMPLCLTAQILSVTRTIFVLYQAALPLIVFECVAIHEFARQNFLVALLLFPSFAR